MEPYRIEPCPGKAPLLNACLNLVISSIAILLSSLMTGPWQVSGRSDLSTTESEALDMSYVWTWSVLGNMALPFGTVGAALGRKGAC